MKKYRIASLFLTALLLLCTVLPAAAADASLDYRTYTLTDAPAGLSMSFYHGVFSRGFAWITAKDVEDTELYVAKIPEGGITDTLFDGVEPITGTSHVTFSPDGLRLAVHQVQIEDLEPGTKYAYRAGGAGQYVDGTFETAPEKSGTVTVLNLNDAQTKKANLYGVWENTVRTALNRVGDTRLSFIGYGGDLFDANQYDPADDSFRLDQYLRWCLSVDTVSPVLRCNVLAASGGNHESYEQNLYCDMNNVAFAGTSEDNVGGYYSFRDGIVHYVVLSYFTDLNDDAFRAEYDWLKADLEAANADPGVEWIVVQMHWGPYTTGDHGADGKTETLITTLAPLFSEQHVDLVLQAHDHTFSKTVPYLWDAAGYESEFDDETVVNLSVETVQIDGVTYDSDPHGTYYVSVGASGHRVGENRDYADKEYGAYRRNTYKTQIGTVNVPSDFFEVGEPSTGDLGKQMFGVLTVAGDKLSYDFYAVTGDSESVLVDTLRVKKEIAKENMPGGGLSAATIIVIIVCAAVLLGSLVLILILSKKERTEKDAPLAE